MEWTIKPYPGYYGAFTKDQAPGAFPNGSRIVKHAVEEGDGTLLGHRGTVLGSMLEPEVSPFIFYFVEWDTRPRAAVCVVSWKIALLNESG